MKILKGVRALLFDVFGTLVDWRQGIARQVAPFLVQHGASETNPLSFADAWRRRYSPALEEVRSGRRPFTRLDILHRENLESTLLEFGINPSRVPGSELEELNLAWHRLDPWPDVVVGLTRLRTGYIIAPFSNGNLILLIDLAKRAGMPWDAILGAEVVQAYKPTPAAYLRTMEILGMSPHEVCLVAAHNNDLDAARKCGLRTVFVPRPSEDLHPEQQWDAAVKNLEELAVLLDL